MAIELTPETLAALGMFRGMKADQVRDWFSSVLKPGVLRLGNQLLPLRSEDPVTVSYADLRQASGRSQAMLQKDLRPFKSPSMIVAHAGQRTRLLGPPRFHASLVGSNSDPDFPRYVKLRLTPGIECPLIDYEKLHHLKRQTLPIRKLVMSIERGRLRCEARVAWDGGTDAELQPNARYLLLRDSQVRLENGHLGELQSDTKIVFRSGRTVELLESALVRFVEFPKKKKTSLARGERLELRPETRIRIAEGDDAQWGRIQLRFLARFSNADAERLDWGQGDNWLQGFRSDIEIVRLRRGLFAELTDVIRPHLYSRKTRPWCLALGLYDTILDAGLPERMGSTEATELFATLQDLKKSEEASVKKLLEDKYRFRLCCQEHRLKNSDLCDAYEPSHLLGRAIQHLRGQKTEHLFEVLYDDFDHEKLPIPHWTRSLACYRPDDPYAIKITRELWLSHVDPEEVHILDLKGCSPQTVPAPTKRKSVNRDSRKEGSRREPHAGKNQQQQNHRRSRRETPSQSLLDQQQSQHHRQKPKRQ